MCTATLPGAAKGARRQRSKQEVGFSHFRQKELPPLGPLRLRLRLLPLTTPARGLMRTRTSSAGWTEVWRHLWVAAASLMLHLAVARPPWTTSRLPIATIVAGRVAMRTQTRPPASTHSGRASFREGLRPSTATCRGTQATVQSHCVRMCGLHASARDSGR